METGAKIRTMRNIKKLSLTELSARTGIPEKDLSRIENGETMPEKHAIRKIAEAIGVSPNILTPQIDVKTAAGTLIAKPLADEEYPGIAVMLTDEDGYETACVMLSCNKTKPEEKPEIEAWIYRTDNPDGADPSFKIRL